MNEPSKYSITIGWLYPELMSTYGDRGNIFILTKRSEWRQILVTVQSIDFTTTEKEIRNCDVIVGGGAQDRQQGITITDLREKKGPILSDMFAQHIPGLFVCGAPQLLGHSYMTGEGIVLKGLGIFDMETRHFGKKKPRCIGNTVCELNPEVYTNVLNVLNLPSQQEHLPIANTIVGFENHGGRTYLGSGVKPLATVIKGFGNNGEDNTEGAIYNNCIATYSHGPFLSKNPHIADLLISNALTTKYKKHIPLTPLDDTLPWKAHYQILHRLTT